MVEWTNIVSLVKEVEWSRKDESVRVLLLKTSSKLVGSWAVQVV